VATSTEATVRSTIVAALQAIAVTGLGFDESNGNIRAYPIEFEQEENRDSYLSATVSGAKVVRCWSVDVRGREEHGITGDAGILSRFYDVTVKGYYAVGVDGAGYQTIIDHGRKVLSLGLEPAGTTGNVIGGELRYVFERRNPDW
jgi:hypothetical protein